MRRLTRVVEHSRKPFVLLRPFVVAGDEPCRRPMPARFTELERPALACAVGGVDFIRLREDDERVAVVVHEGIGFNLLSGARDRHLPAQVVRLVKSLRYHFLHRFLV